VFFNNLLGELYVLRARAAVFSGSEDNLLRDIDRAVEIFRDGSTVLFSESKYLRGVWLSKQGRYPEAKQDLLEAHMSFIRCGDRAGSATALSRLSYTHLMMGDIDAATHSLEECTQIYTELGNCKNQVACSNNLCHLYFKAGRLTDSVSGFTEIEPQIPNLGGRSLLIYYFNFAISLAAKGQVSEARKAIAKCEPYLDMYGRERGIYFENLGLINILDGKYKAAEKALTFGLDTARELESAPALVSQIKRLFGDLYIATKQWDKAEQFTNEGLTVAEKIGERVEIAACYRIYAQLEQHDGHDDKAREWFTKAIDLFSLIGSNYELAVTRYLAGVSGLYQNGERQALLYMARRYFDSEQVKPYLKKIDAALSISTLSRKARKGDLVPPTVVAKSKVMTDIVSLAEQVAPSNMTVFLTGPTGTGKDLMARYIHCHSGRTGEFVSVNAAAIPGPMIESELFGHTKGAFTGSDGDRVGLLQQAHNGTFYLNEIADASMEFQTKLLEVLETRQIRRLGENKNRPAAFRLIAATNHDLKQRISEGKFRLDLYHRLNEIPIELPPLSQHSEDVEPLASYFLEHEGCDVKHHNCAVTSLGVQFRRCLMAGNVRQLQAEVKRLWLVSRGDLDRMIALVRQTADCDERECLRQVLIECDWNRREAARRLDIDESTVRRRMRRHCLVEPQLS